MIEDHSSSPEDTAGTLCVATGGRAPQLHVLRCRRQLHTWWLTNCCSFSILSAYVGPDIGACAASHACLIKTMLKHSRVGLHAGSCHAKHASTSATDSPGFLRFAGGMTHRWSSAPAESIMQGETVGSETPGCFLTVNQLQRFFSATMKQQHPPSWYKELQPWCLDVCPP